MVEVAISLREYRALNYYSNCWNYQVEQGLGDWRVDMVTEDGCYTLYYSVREQPRMLVIHSSLEIRNPEIQQRLREAGGPLPPEEAAMVRGHNYRGVSWQDTGPLATEFIRQAVNFGWIGQHIK